jgi:hypothetical protein
MIFRALAICALLLMLYATPVQVNGQSLTRDDPSDETQAPYRMSGLPVIGRLKEETRQVQSATEFPNARGCLSIEQREATHPDYANIDFSLFRTTEDVNVCIFRIAAQLHDKNDLIRVLNRAGLTVKSSRRVHGTSLGVRNGRDRVYSMIDVVVDYASFLSIAGHSLIGSGYGSFKSFSITIVLDDNSMPWNVGSVFNPY